MKADRKRFTFYITETQAAQLGKFANRQLAKRLTILNDLPPAVITDDPIQPANINVGGLLTSAHYEKLKTLAEANGLSMSKAAIRLLQLPE